MIIEDAGHIAELLVAAAASDRPGEPGLTPEGAVEELVARRASIEAAQSFRLHVIELTGGTYASNGQDNHADSAGESGYQ